MTERILTMPRLGETMDEGKVVSWLIQPGDAFKRGDSILEIETDKTIAELPALGDGRLNETLVSIGDVVEVGKPLAKIDIGDGPDWTHEDDNAAQPSVEDASAPVASAAMTPPIDLPNDPPDPTDPPQADTPVHIALPQNGRVRATPAARKLARRHRLDLAAIAGSGRRGRVEKADALAAIGSVCEPAEVRFAALCRGRIAYSDSGAIHSKATLLLHGFAGDHTTWAAVAAGLKRAGRRVILPDLPGHGRTDIAAQNTADLGHDLPGFLDALGLAKVDVVAHSLGAVAALDLAQAAPERIGSLSLIAPVGLGAEIDNDFIHGMAQADAPGQVAHLLRRLCVNAMDLSPTTLAALALDLSQGRLVALADAIVGTSGQKIDTLPAIARLASKTPIRVLFGLEDRIIPWQHVLALPPTVAVHLLARAGHMPQWDQIQDVLDVLTF